MRGSLFKKQIIVGIIILLTSTSIIPVFSGETTQSDKEQHILSPRLLTPEKTTTITFYVIEKTKLEKHNVIVSIQDATQIYTMLQELKKELAAHPYNERTQQLEQDFLNLLTERHAIPAGISQQDIMTLLQPPATPAHSLLKGILPLQGKTSEWFCNFATTGDGSAFPIIILPRLIPIILAPIPRAFVYWSTPDGVTSVGGLISRTGFIAGGQQKGIALGFWGIGVSIFLPPVDMYGMIGYAVYTKVTAEEYQYWPPNNPPKITQTDPADGQQLVPLSTKELRFSISDADKDLMSFNVTTNPDIGSGSGGLKLDGTYSIPISGLESLTTYTCDIQVTDGKDTTEKTITFTTAPTAPVVSNPSPKDNAQYVPIETSTLSFNLKDYQGNLMDWTVVTQPDIGLGSANNVHDGQYNVVISGLNYFTTYKWFVNVTDGENWTKKTFVFRTIAEGTLVFEPTDDSYVSSTAPDQNAGSIDSMSIRSGGYGDGWWASPTIKFDVSSVPPGSEVLSATVNLYYFNYADGNPVGRHLVMYRFLGDWNENTITWANMPQASPTQSAIAYDPDSPGVWISWDVTNDVKDIVNGTTSNYGWIIMDETTSGVPLTYVHSKEYGTLCPYLLIETNTKK